MFNQNKVRELKLLYPEGTRIMLFNMDDPYAPVPPKTKGIVSFIDDAGNIHMLWDNGRTLSLCPEVDLFSAQQTSGYLSIKRQKFSLPKKTMAIAVVDNSFVRSQFAEELFKHYRQVETMYASDFSVNIVAPGTCFVYDVGIPSKNYMVGILTVDTTSKQSWFDSMKKAYAAAFRYAKGNDLSILTKYQPYQSQIADWDIEFSTINDMAKTTAVNTTMYFSF